MKGGVKENFQAVQTAISKAGELQQWVALDNPEDTVPVLWSDPENKLSRTFIAFLIGMNRGRRAS